MHINHVLKNADMQNTLKSIMVFKYLFLYSFKGGVNQGEATSRLFMRVKRHEPMKNPFLQIFADVSKNLVTSYGFLGWNFFQEVLVHVHAKGFSKGPSGTVLFRVGVNLPPPPSTNDSVTTTLHE